MFAVYCPEYGYFCSQQGLEPPVWTPNIRSSFSQERAKEIKRSLDRQDYLGVEIRYI